MIKQQEQDARNQANTSDRQDTHERTQVSAEVSAKEQTDELVDCARYIPLVNAYLCMTTYSLSLLTFDDTWFVVVMLVVLSSMLHAGAACRVCCRSGWTGFDGLCSAWVLWCDVPVVVYDWIVCSGVISHVYRGSRHRVCAQGWGMRPGFGYALWVLHSGPCQWGRVSKA